MACIYTIGKIEYTESEFKKYLEENLKDHIAKKDIVLSKTKENIPPKPPVEEEEKKAGASHKALQELADQLGLEQPERGEVLEPEEYANRGRELINSGADIEAIKKDWDKNKSINTDIISVAGQHFVDLSRAVDSALRDFGKDSQEYKDAKKLADDFQKDYLKPMANEWGQSGRALQGKIGLDTGSFYSMENAFKEENKRDPTPKESAEIKRLSAENKRLQDAMDKNDADLPKIIDKAIADHDAEQGARKKKNIFELSDTEKADRAKLKQKFAGRFNDISSMATLLADKEFLKYGRLLAKEAAFDFTEFSKKAVADLGEKVKPMLQEWFDKVGEDNKEERLISQNIKALETKLKKLQSGIIDKPFEKRTPSAKEVELKEQIQAEKEKLGLAQPKEKPIDVLTHFSGRKGNKFTPQEVKAIWEYAKQHYIDKGVKFGEMFSKVGADLGLSAEQVRNAIALPKGIKPIIEERYKIQSRRTKAIAEAKAFVADANKSRLEKAIMSVPAFFFEKAVFGHGTVGMITHAGMNIYSPKSWGAYFHAFPKQFEYMLKPSIFEKAKEDFVNHPDFSAWKRAGLKVDPFKVTDDYGVLKKLFAKRYPKVAEAGDRGFFALKVFRLGLAKSMYDGMSDAQKADPNMRKEIAQIVNHASGTHDFNAPAWVNASIFAPRLEASRWSRLVGQPLSAINTYTKMIGGKDISPSERAKANIIAKRAGAMISVYVAGLAVNQALLSASGSNQKINFTSPSDADWLKFKGFGKTIDVTGGMVSTLRFISNLVGLANETRQQMFGQTREAKFGAEVIHHVRGKLAPFPATVADFGFSHDLAGNTMPFSDEKPDHKWNRNLTWGDYIINNQLPIPVSEAFRTMDESMREKGMSEKTIKDVMSGILNGIITGGTGAQVFADHDKQ